MHQQKKGQISCNCYNGGGEQRSQVPTRVTLPNLSQNDIEQLSKSDHNMDCHSAWSVDKIEALS